MLIFSYRLLQLVFFPDILSENMVDLFHPVIHKNKPVYFNKLIFTVTNEGYLAVINYENGDLIRSTYLFNSFKSKKRKNIKPIGFIVGKKNIYLTLNNGRLMVISISNGNVESIIKIDKEKISSPVVQGQNLYITKNNSIIKLN